MRSISRRFLLSFGGLLLLGVFIVAVGFYRFGNDPRLAFVLLENCEAAVLRLVKTPSAMTLLNARIYKGGNLSISEDDQRAFKSSTAYAEVVARGDGRFFYPAVNLEIEALNSFGVKQVDTVLCRYGGVEYKNGALLSLRLMTLDLGSGILRNPFVYNNAKFAEWAKLGIIDVASVDEFTWTEHWRHFFDLKIKVVDLDGEV
ncbi:hypothetical protein [Pseudomonas sp. 18175]|uniref:hypothetical protein n=1 Tax=Pseudomonas sp. 18175 TaxID=3390056 RepID=UPI003D199EF7